MSKDTGKPPVTEPTADAATEEPGIDRLLGLSKSVAGRQRASEADRMARVARTRGWTREELYERGSRDDD